MDFQPTLVKKWRYRGYTCFIVYFMGHFCAYVVIPRKSIFYKNTNWEEAPISKLEVHGGVTFTDKHPMVNNRWCVGWDYAHFDDYVCLPGELLPFEPLGGKVWTDGEVAAECESAVDQIIELEALAKYDENKIHNLEYNLR